MTSYIYLLLWMLLYPLMIATCERLQGYKNSEKANLAIAYIYLIGIVFWTIIGFTY